MEVQEHAGTWQHIVEYMASGWKHYDRNYYNNTWGDWREWKLTDNNTTYSDATTSAHGLMTAADKTKLNGIATGAEVNQNAFSNITVGSTTVSADGKTDTLTLVAGSNITLTPDATNDKITIAATDTNTTYSVATTSANGLMSSTDKSKLEGIASGAEVNQNAFGNVKVGSVTVAADGKTDTLTLVAGSNVTLTGDATNDKVTIAATNTTYSDATTSAHGLMTAADKTKLNGIASGAEVNQNAFSNVTVGSTTIAADGKTDTLTLVAGSNVTLTPDATNDKVTIAATNTTYTGSSPITVSGTTISHATSGVSQDTYGSGTETTKTPRFGDTFYCPSFDVNSTGHIVEAYDGKVKIPNSTATTSAAGLMSASDKSRLDALHTNNYTTMTIASGISITSGGVFASRFGPMVSITTRAGGLKLKAAISGNTWITLGSVGSNYACSSSDTPMTTYGVCGNTQSSIRVDSSGNVYIYRYSSSASGATDTIHFSISFHKRDW